MIVAEYRERDLSASDYGRRDPAFLPPAPYGIPQPPGIPYYTQGVTGHHILSVKSFTKDQVKYCSHEINQINCENLKKTKGNKDEINNKMPKHPLYIIVP